MTTYTGGKPIRSNRYRILLFDLDGTLFDYDQAYKQALKETLPELFEEVGADAVISTFHQANLALWEEVEQGRVTVNSLRTLRFSKLFNTYRWDKQDPEVMGRKYIRILANQAQLMDQAREVITNLGNRFQLGVITNGIASVQRKRLELSGLTHFFDPIVISFEYQTSKPEPEIFDIAVEQSGLPRESTLYIGDSVTSDMAGANNAGIDFCWFNPQNLDVPDRYDVRFNIQHLDELLKIL